VNVRGGRVIRSLLQLVYTKRMGPKWGCEGHFSHKLLPTTITLRKTAKTEISSIMMTAEQDRWKDFAFPVVQVSCPKPSGNAAVLAWIDPSWVVRSASVVGVRVVADLDTSVANVVIVH
jgi:hypothetical protein